MKLVVETIHFGLIEYQPQDLLHFPEGLLGFQNLKSFLLVEGEEYNPFKFLQSTENPHICFPLIDPRLVSQQYRLEIPESDQEKLHLNRSEEGVVFSIVTLGEDSNQATANLFAPLLINPAEMKGAQLILSESDYNVAEPICG